MLATRTTTLLAGVILVSAAFQPGCGSSVEDQQTSGGAGGAGGSGGGAVAGEPAVLFDVGPLGYNPWRLTVDATNVYVTDARGTDIGVVFAIPLDGSPMKVLASGMNVPDAIAVQGSDLFVTSAAGLFKIPTTGGTPTLLGPGKSAGHSGVVTHDGFVYWTSYATPGGVARIKPDGTDLLTYDAQDGYPSGIAVSGSHVYWASFGDYSLKTAPIAGGATSVFVAMPGTVRHAVVADDSFVYSVGESPIGGDGSPVLKVPLAGGAPIELAMLKGPYAWMGTEAVVDSKHLYFNAIGSDTKDCPIVRIPINGGEPELIPVPENLGCPTSLAQDAANLYFAHPEGVSRIPK